MQLNTSQELSAKAGTGAVITCTLFGDAVSGGADTFQRLSQVQLNTTPTTLYTAPGSTQTLIKEIQLANTSASPVLGVTFYSGGTSVANQLNGGFTVPANGSAMYRDGQWNIYDSTGSFITTVTVTLTGDVTGSGTNTIATTLATVNASPGTFGGVNSIPIVTVNGKGLSTVITASSPQITENQVTNLVSDLASKVVSVTNADGTIVITGGATTPVVSRAGITGDVLIPAATNIATLATVNGNVGSFGVANAVPSFTVNAKGLITAVVNTSIQIAESQVTNLVSDLAGKVPTTRLINTTSPIQGGGDLSTDRTLTLLTSPTGQIPVGTTRLITATSPIRIDGGASADLSNNRTLSILAATSLSAGSMAASDVRKLELHIYDVMNDYGADNTGVVDATTAIQNAVNDAQVAGYVGGSGGIIWFPAGRYKISSTINVTGHGIKFWGVNGGYSLDFGNYYTSMGSTLVPTGAFTAIKVAPDQTQGLNGVPNTGFGLHNLSVDCYASNGTIGLQLLSCTGFDIDNYYCINPTGTGLDFNCLPAAKTVGTVGPFPIAATTITVNSTAANGTGPAFNANSNTAGSFIMVDGTGTRRVITYTGGNATQFTGCSSGGLGSGSTGTGANVTILPGAQDCTRGHVGRIAIRTIEGGGVAIRMDGDGAGIANTNLISFNNSVVIAHFNGIGIKDINSDTNEFTNVVINRASGGTAVGVEIGAAATATGASRNNVFRHLSAGTGGITARGTPTAAFASGPTYVYDLQLANGEALPTVETGAAFFWTPNGGINPGQGGTTLVAAQTISAATLTQITGTQVVLPPQAIQAGTKIRWTVEMSKTAAGVASRRLGLRVGPTGNTTDTEIVAVILPTGTAAADIGKLTAEWVIYANGASTVSRFSTHFIHGSSPIVTGFMTRNFDYQQLTPATFSSVTSGMQYAALALTTGAAEVITVQQAASEVVKAANP